MYSSGLLFKNSTQLNIYASAWNNSICGVLYEVFPKYIYCHCSEIIILPALTIGIQIQSIGINAMGGDRTLWTKPAISNSMTSQWLANIIQTMPSG